MTVASSVSLSREGDAPLGALDLAADAVEAVLDLKDLVDRRRLAEEEEELALRRLQVTDAGREVAVLLRDVAGVGSLAIHLGAEGADLAQDVLIAGRRHADRHGSDLLLALEGEVGAGDEAAGRRSDAAHRLEARADFFDLEVQGRRLDDLAVVAEAEGVGAARGHGDAAVARGHAAAGLGLRLGCEVGRQRREAPGLAAEGLADGGRDALVRAEAGLVGYGGVRAGVAPVDGVTESAERDEGDGAVAEEAAELLIDHV